MVRSWSYEEELGGRTPDLCKTELGGRGPRSCETEVSSSEAEVSSSEAELSSSEAEVSSGGRDTRRSGDLEVVRTRRSWRPGGELVETWRS